MNYLNESSFNRAWSRWLEAAGARVFAVVGNTYQESGWPDRYVAHRRWTGWLEGKADAGQLTLLQRGVMMDLLARGVPALEIHLLRETGFVVIKHPGDGRELGKIDLAELDSLESDRERGHKLLGALTSGA